MPGGPFLTGRQLPWGSPGPFSSRKKEQGQSLVEFALILPVALFLLLGTIDVARAFFNLQTVTNASREGARRGIIAGAVQGDVDTVVNNALTSAGLTSTPTIVGSGVDGASAGATTTVTVTYPFQTLTGTLIPGWTGTIDLTQTTVMRHE